MRRKMIILPLLCAALLLPPQAVRAEPSVITTVSADITENTTWESGKTYVIQKDAAEHNGGVGSDSAYKGIVEVARGATLTIESGATVLFGVECLESVSNSTATENLSDKLIVHGTLNATGATITDYYHYYGIFAEDPNPNNILTYGRFTGFQFLPDYETGGAVTGSFQNCTFTGGGYKSDAVAEAAIAAKHWGEAANQSVSLTVNHCTFTDASFIFGHNSTRGRAISVDLGSHACTLNVTDCTFGAIEKPYGNAIMVGGSAAQLTVSNCQFLNCDNGHTQSVIEAARGTGISITGSTFTTKPNMYNPISVQGIQNLTDRGTIEDNTFQITCDSGVTLSSAMSGLPIKSLTITGGTLTLPTGQSDFELNIIDVLSVSGTGALGKTLTSTHDARLILGENATVDGFTLYEADGTTVRTKVTSAAETYQYGNGHWCLQGVTNTHVTAPQGATLILATYDGGRMADVHVQTLTYTYVAKSLGQLLIYPPTDGTHYKLFLLDGDGRPLCPAYDSAS